MVSYCREFLWGVFAGSICAEFLWGVSVRSTFSEIWKVFATNFPSKSPRRRPHSRPEASKIDKNEALLRRRFGRLTMATGISDLDPFGSILAAILDDCSFYVLALFFDSFV